jgi:hypothetical protein
MNPFAAVAVWGFWPLLAVGWWLDELRVKGVAIFVVLWIGGLLLTNTFLSPIWFLPYVAVLDVVLVLAVFKGDVTLR